LEIDIVYRNIKKRREELKISQRTLASILGYKHSSSINKIELGINDIPMRKVEEFAAALHTTIEALMGWEEFSEHQINILNQIKAEYGRNAVRLLEDFTRLNNAGQNMAIEQMSVLTESYRYTKKDDSATRAR
jgi:transcriptional regulator with XRE-family HTH domain